MQVPRLDSRATQLLRKVGAGRRIELDGGTLSLTYRRSHGGRGVLIRGALGEEPLRLWVSERQWCEWVGPLLAVPDASNIAPELCETLAAWTVDSLGTDLDRSLLDWPIGSALQGEDAPRQFGWCLHAERGGRRLDALVLEAPHAWLDAVADQLTPYAAESAGHADVRVRLVAGWTRLARSAVASLSVGDALVLRQAYRVAQREFVLFMDKPLARVRYSETGVPTVEEIMQDFDDWLDAEPTPPIAAPSMDDLPDLPDPPLSDIDPVHDPVLTIVAEVGSFVMPASKLAALKSGDVLDGSGRADDLVTLKVGGRIIGRATLLDIDGQLAARMETR